MCRLSIDRIIGPYYFDQPIVTCESYLHLLNNDLLPMLSHCPVNNFFQHDGAHPHKSRAVRDLSDE